MISGHGLGRALVVSADCMPSSLKTILEAIEKGLIPSVILVGGDQEYLTQNAFTRLREAIVKSAPDASVETFSETSDLSSVIDSYRTMSLFGNKRLLVLPEVNAFVTRKEIAGLLDKALGDWSSAKTDRKRSSSAAKLLHILGLAGLDLEDRDDAIAEILSPKKGKGTLVEMLGFARSAGMKASRGEGDAALLAEAVTRGGAVGTTLLMKAGELPRDSATVEVIAKAGAVISCDLTREEFDSVLQYEAQQRMDEVGVRFERKALAVLRRRLGIDRILGDKFSSEVPDLRHAISQIERLAMFVGTGGVVDESVVEQQISEVTGGARYELGSLFAERKPLQALAKLRDLVAQSRREDPRSPSEIHFGKFLFPLADEVRQLLAIRSFAAIHGMDVRKSMQYNRFRDSIAEPLGEYLKASGLVRQKPHPFALHRRYEGARLYSETELFEALAQLAEMDFLRKSGGASAEASIENFLVMQLPLSD